MNLKKCLKKQFNPKNSDYKYLGAKDGCLYSDSKILTHQTTMTVCTFQKRLSMINLIDKSLSTFEHILEKHPSRKHEKKESKRRKEWDDRVKKVR